ncbi:amino acid permease [Actinomyces slackii]|uniref:Lysine-specific permease n=1 Tax=Actinomyces slackii TaxID=52774 RepID=A0A448KAT1_9ACTO|nr:amino acid permease [Actinomyces slackii]VEG74038.1 Lysine-specific permease [Actinomyces slackii]
MGNDAHPSPVPPAQPAAAASRTSTGQTPPTDSGAGLQRTLKARHVNLIAVGGAIGTGLFVGTGASISTAGPAGAIVSYGLIGLAIYFMMTALGEMVTHRPVAGAFETYTGEYVEPAVGFMLGWTYWYSCAMTIAVELVATSIIMKFWFPGSPSLLWSALFLAIILGLNLFSAKAFGEAEFWFAGIKVVTIIVFLVLGVAMIVGIMGGASPGLDNWVVGEAPFVGGLGGTLGVLMVAGFSFIGVESAAVAAGEAENPRVTMPRAINSVFWRILLFYVGAIAVVSTLVAYTDPSLLQASEENIAASPFTLVFKRAGLAAAAAVMNAVVLSSVLSAGNSTLYIGSRLLYSMAHTGRAPRIFARTSAAGVPVAGVIATVGISTLGFLSSLVGDSVAYTWFYNATGLTGFIVWAGVCVAHLRFRAAWRAQGRKDEELAYRAKLYPVGTWLSLIVFLGVIAGQGLNLALSGEFTWYGVLVAYVGLPIAVALWLGYKVARRSRLVSLRQMDLSASDVAE